MSEESQLCKTHKLHFLFQIILRILAIGAAAAAASLMFSNHQSTVLFGLQIEARYNQSPAFKFFVIANTIGLVLSVLSLVLVSIIGRKAVDPTYYFYLFLQDLIVSLVLMAGFAAAAAIGHVGKYGSSASGWMPICDHFGKFCHRSMISFIFGILGVLIYLILTVLSAKRSRQIEA